MVATLKFHSEWECNVMRIEFSLKIVLDSFVTRYQKMRDWAEYKYEQVPFQVWKLADRAVRRSKVQFHCLFFCFCFFFLFKMENIDILCVFRMSTQKKSNSKGDISEFRLCIIKIKPILSRKGFSYQHNYILIFIRLMESKWLPTQTKSVIVLLPIY